MSTNLKKPLSILSLVAINVIAIDSLRTLPFSAMYGFSAVFYYLLAALIFFLPVSLVSAELATAWPETGGVYVWTREAFGKKIGLLTIWLQWFYNIVWYPTIMSLIAVTIAYTFNPSLEHDKWYMLSVMVIVFWGATWVNCLGMRAASWLSDLSAIAGTLLPMLFIVALGVAWVVMGKPLQITFSAKTFFPDLSNVNNLVLLIAILYGLVGMEMSASHAREVVNPQRDYPKAVFYSIIVILVTLILGSLAISIVVPVKNLNVVSGLLQAFSDFFAAFHMSWLMPILAILIVFGAIGGAAAWMLGPSKGMLMACRDGSLPQSLGKTGVNNTPTRILVVQGIIFTLLCSVFVFMPTVRSGFWVLTDVTSILALLVYIIMFPAAIVLRYKYPEKPRPYRIPGGKIGLWITCMLGLITCLFAVAIGFVPPSQIAVGSVFVYEMIIIIGVIAGCVAPFVFILFNKKIGKRSVL
ncbi:MAG: transporter [Gammaproteobacteria bacterium RIFCSPLOWO2_02_FULL_42_14]|nr:MAG: transporter [Gammaproteobacteria bacterium RIFCSPHIGHO2_02_FULL_42_43]OGT27775.1 MAG: transporter [Gammaproteobacteria bacterium RIFCSPHIGHO2_01_FULL_42_8]OGT52387.1 MAG: transporter [Gammaproteobacteria bacterium RIFCSPHIGHO2_12_FULL_41_25]OGT62485.1 MAG: transporter [Gammaproteobacteria bacterium RIFCSPLOWO2_02_FULL_42_14]OGT86289.1 MAG: transporter [Gammaproteobacteria bacterium RIFCSPLOWO2_12_FULL_42_18]